MTTWTSKPLARYAASISRRFLLELGSPWPQRTSPIRPVPQEIRPCLHESVLWRWRMCFLPRTWGIRRRHVCFFLTDTTPPRSSLPGCLGLHEGEGVRTVVSTPRASRAATAETTPDGALHLRVEARHRVVSLFLSGITRSLFRSSWRTSSCPGRMGWPLWTKPHPP